MAIAEQIKEKRLEVLTKQKAFVQAQSELQLLQLDQQIEQVTAAAATVPANR